MKQRVKQRNMEKARRMEGNTASEHRTGNTKEQDAGSVSVYETK